MKGKIQEYMVAIGVLLSIALTDLLIWNHVIKLGLPKITYLDSLGILVISNTLFKGKKCKKGGDDLG